VPLKCGRCGKAKPARPGDWAVVRCGKAKPARPGDWAVLINDDPWIDHAVLVLGPVSEGRFEGLLQIMHLDGSTYHVPEYALELIQHGPVVVPEPMHSPLRQHPGLRLRAVVSPGDWAVLVDDDPWKGHVVLVLGPVCEGRFEGLQQIMHLDGSTYHVPKEALELSEHGPAAIPEPMHFPLRQLPLVGLERLRLRAVVSEIPKGGVSRSGGEESRGGVGGGGS